MKFARSFLRIPVVFFEFAFLFNAQKQIVDTHAQPALVRECRFLFSFLDVKNTTAANITANINVSPHTGKLPPIVENPTKKYNINVP